MDNLRLVDDPSYADLNCISTYTSTGLVLIVDTAACTLTLAGPTEPRDGIPKADCDAELAALAACGFGWEVDWARGPFEESAHRLDLLGFESADGPVWHTSYHLAWRNVSRLGW